MRVVKQVSYKVYSSVSGLDKLASFFCDITEIFLVDPLIKFNTTAELNQHLLQCEHFHNNYFSFQMSALHNLDMKRDSCLCCRQQVINMFTFRFGLVICNETIQK